MIRSTVGGHCVIIKVSLKQGLRIAQLNRLILFVVPWDFFVCAALQQAEAF